MDEDQEDLLDKKLREAMPYIDDAGFTARVMAQLPAPGRQRARLRPIILVGITLLGSALAYVLSDGGRFVSVSVARLVSLPTLWLLAVAFACGILVTTGALVAALSKARELQS